MDAIALSLFASRIAAVCDEMGAVLQRAAFSPNIKDRLDFSCAVFDLQGELCAQAAHIPVHLGSMAFAMRSIVGQLRWNDGDMVVLNDPYLGGTHLPDVTLIAPIFCDGALMGYVANRAHHADIGASTPGSMPISSCLEEEGMLIPPSYLISRGQLNETLMNTMIGSTQHPAASRGDFAAQMSANQTGVVRMQTLINMFGADRYSQLLAALNEYAEKLARSALKEIPDGEYQFTDLMDDDGLGQTDIPINVSLSINAGSVHVDFSGTSGQVPGNINCPLSVAAAGVYYVFRCLMPAQTPACSGSFRPITLSAPQGSLLNARRPAAVAAGNVETSSRVVDVVMGALARALPEKMAAASHGSMNNIAMGARGARGAPNDPHSWDYYETVGGGMGASASGAGLSGVQTHMTNTLNTPIESLEMHFPLRVSRYALRDSSGGRGLHAGGDGLIREFVFLEDASITLLTERRRHAPWGLNGGGPGKPGQNLHNNRPLAGKTQLHVSAGDHLTILTPGGGGWGKPQ
ncbi:MAG: hydantoinase B/oxoprolinase family protein [Gammaproteobacteria bacterium]|nr:MAG: hydantoinase B/oxoprolinase family protein [Gammaproteobacteria bacterium]